MQRLKRKSQLFSTGLECSSMFPPLGTKGITTIGTRFATSSSWHRDERNMSGIALSADVIHLELPLLVRSLTRSGHGWDGKVVLTRPHNYLRGFHH